MNKTCYFSGRDYQAELNKFTIMNELAALDVIVQYPYSSESMTDESTAERQKERDALAAKRREQVQRMRERAEKQKQDKLNAKLQQTEALRKLQKDVQKRTSANQGVLDPDDEIVETMAMHGYDTLEELDEATKVAEKDLEAYRNKLAGIEEVKEAPDYSLLEIPDAQLNEQQIKEKRKQRLLKNA